MKQVLQNFKTGKIMLEEVPVPVCRQGGILVQTAYSLISAGTERGTVEMGKASLVGKAKKRPDLVKQVIDNLQREGLRATISKVTSRLDAWKALGYSCSGKVVESRTEDFKVGDRVACAGQDIASHAEYVSVPRLLAARIPENVSFADAAYTTLGAIAMQGVRQADLRIGESCVLIGLGLLGQLTAQILKAAGVQVFGIDINPSMVEKAKENGLDIAFERKDPALEIAIIDATKGHGVDAVIITAATSSLDPIELAGRLARKKGKVVIVGAVPTGFSRENYYKKELELRMSTSYGPGRYDPLYEEKGTDYPYGYVRWTEKRNMEAFLKLVQEGKIKLDSITTHTFDIDNAIQAYDLILTRREPFLGILLRYHPDRPVSHSITLKASPSQGKIKIGFIGAGSFAQAYLLPDMIKIDDIDLVGVATASGNSARTVAERYNFKFATTDYHDIINNSEINTVFIATRHDLHGTLVLEALKAGKNVFVEKPLAISESEIDSIINFFKNNSTDEVPLLMVGFNRRFAPFVQQIKKKLQIGPIAITYRINAGYIPPNHWTQDMQVGGGRIVGEVCHFVDLAMYLAGCIPVSVSAVLMDDPQHLNDTLTINLKFQNGSVANICYFANGSKALEKENLEVYGNGTTAILNDFKALNIYAKKKKQYKSFSQDKGHKEEVEQFLKALKNGQPSPISFNELYISSLIPFKIIESIKTSKLIKLQLR